MTQIPDAPFRSGSTGKYKLLIKDVTPKFNGYEYLLVAADGKEYNSVAKEHYAPGRQFVKSKILLFLFLSHRNHSRNLRLKSKQKRKPRLVRKRPTLIL